MAWMHWCQSSFQRFKTRRLLLKFRVGEFFFHFSQLRIPWLRNSNRSVHKISCSPSRWTRPLVSSKHRHWDLRPGLPGQGQEDQGLLRPEADEDPRRDPTKARAARPQREGGPDGGQPPLSHPAVSLWNSLAGGGLEVTSFFCQEGQRGHLCTLDYS